MRTRYATLAVAAVGLSACGGWYNPFAGVGRLFSIIHTIANIIITYDIVQSRRATVTKVIWIAFVWLVPIIGILAYLIFERK